jgi:hypothetical protein
MSARISVTFLCDAFKLDAINDDKKFLLFSKPLYVLAPF